MVSCRFFICWFKKVNHLSKIIHCICIASSVQKIFLSSKWCKEYKTPYCTDWDMFNMKLTCINMIALYLLDSWLSFYLFLVFKYQWNRIKFSESPSIMQLIWQQLIEIARRLENCFGANISYKKNWILRFFERSKRLKNKLKITKIFIYTWNLTWCKWINREKK